MPVVGVRVRTAQHFVSLRTFVPDGRIDFDDLKDTLVNRVQKYETEDIVEMGNSIASSMEDMLTVFNAPYFTVDLLNQKGHIYEISKIKEDEQDA